MATDSTDPTQEYDDIPDLPGPDHRAADPRKKVMSAPMRKWLYVVLTAVIPLLIVYGVVDDLTAPLWLALGGAVLGFPLAAANTPASDRG